MVTRQPMPAVDVPNPVNPIIRFCRRTARWIVPIGMYALIGVSTHYLRRRIGDGPATDWLTALIPILLVLSMGLNLWRPRSAILASIPFLMEVTIWPATWQWCRLSQSPPPDRQVRFRLLVYAPSFLFGVGALLVLAVGIFDPTPTGRPVPLVIAALLLWCSVDTVFVAQLLRQSPSRLPNGPSLSSFAGAA